MRQRWLVPSTYFHWLRRRRPLSRREERNCFWGLPRRSHQSLGPRNEDSCADIGYLAATDRRHFRIPRVFICRCVVAVDGRHGPLLGT